MVSAPGKPNGPPANSGHWGVDWGSAGANGCGAKTDGIESKLIDGIVHLPPDCRGNPSVGCTGVGFAEESITLGVDVSIVGWGVEVVLGPAVELAPFEEFLAAGGFFSS